MPSLNDKIALIPAGSASKVVYFATILHAHNLKVAALLDSDNAGDASAQQGELVHSVGNKGILRTADFSDGQVTSPEIEDLLRETLLQVAKNDLGSDLSVVAGASNRSMASIMKSTDPKLSKYKLAKAFVRWCRSHSADDLTPDERAQWSKMFAHVNASLK